MTILQELWEMNKQLAEEEKKPLKKAAASVYHRDYMKTRKKPYRKYDQQERASEPSEK